MPNGRRSLAQVALAATVLLAADAQGTPAPGTTDANPEPNYPGGRDSWTSAPGFIDALSKRLWADRGLRKKRIDRPLAGWEFRSLALAQRALDNGDRERALRILKRATATATRMSHRATLAAYRFLLRLAEQQAAAGELEQAGEAYREALMLGPYLPEQYTAKVLNELISTHFDMREYEAALMFIRVGVAVLDDVGPVPYLAMNRIIEEMQSLDDAVEDLEYDFDGAMNRLEAAAAAAEQRGLVIADQWWAPVYEARHDREQAIALLKDLLAWAPEDAMRDAASDEDAAAEPP